MACRAVAAMVDRMQALSQTQQTAGLRTLGRDLGPVGRLARVVAGLSSIGIGVWLAAHEGISALDVAAIGGYLVLIALFYLAITAVLRPRLLGRISPWTATTLFLTPAVVLGVLPAVPTSLRVAVTLYYGASLLLIAAIRYGGCEVVGIPMALLRRRDVIYCPLNAIDAVERPLAHLPHRSIALVAAGLAAAAGVGVAIKELGVSLPVDVRWAAVLLLPALVVLGRHAWHARGSSGSSKRFGSGLGAFTLAAAAVTVATTGSVSLFFAAVLALMLVGGVIAAVWQAARRLPRRGEPGAR